MFEDSFGQQLGFDRRTERKAWATTFLFHSWCDPFRSLAVQTRLQDFGVALIIENCRADGLGPIRTEFPKITVISLLSKTTSMLQPLDTDLITGIMLSFKAL